MLLCPQEIKNQIYKLVLGGNWIHIEHNYHGNRSDFYHGLYHDAYPYLDPASSYCERKEFQLVLGNIFPYHPPDKSNVALLHVCHQIYIEARFIVFSYNTFVIHIFPNVRILQDFIHPLGLQLTGRNLAMRSLHLLILRPTYGAEGLRKAVEEMVREMGNLERVSVGISEPDGPRQKDKLAALQPILDSLKLFAQLPLRSMTVVMKNKALEEYARKELAISPHAALRP